MTLAPALRCVRLAALGAALTFATTALAEEPAPIRLRVRVDPGVGCIDEERLRLGLSVALVEERLAPSSTNTSEELLVEVVRNGELISGTLSWLRRDGEAHGTSAPISVPWRACADLRDGLVLALRVWLPNTPPASQQTERSERSGETPQPPTAEPQERHGPTAEPPHPEAPPTAPTTEPTRPPRRTPAAGVPIGLSLIASVAVDDTAALSLGAGVGLRYGRDRWRAALSLHWNHVIGDATTSRNDVSIGLDRWSAVLRGCYGNTTLGGCVVAEAGLVLADVSGAAVPRRALPPTFAVGPGGEVVLFSGSPVALRLYLDVLFTVAGATLTIDRSSGAEDAWSSPSVMVVFGIAPTWHPSPQP